MTSTHKIGLKGKLMKNSTRVKIGLKGKLMKTSNKVEALAFIYANAGHQKDVTRNRENLFLVGHTW